MFFLSLLAWADICATELATWGVGPDVNLLLTALFLTITPCSVGGFNI